MEDKWARRQVSDWEMALMLGVQPSTVQKWMRNGKLPDPLFTGPGYAVWTTKDLLEWVEKELTEKANEASPVALRIHCSVVNHSQGRK